MEGAFVVCLKIKTYRSRINLLKKHVNHATDTVGGGVVVKFAVIKNKIVNMQVHSGPAKISETDSGATCGGK